MNDDLHTVTFRLPDGTAEDVEMTTGELLDLNTKWMAPDEPKAEGDSDDDDR